MRVLLAIGDVGGGHRAAASALTEALKRHHPKLEVLIEDFYALVDPSPLGNSNAAQRHLAAKPWLLRLVNDPLWHLGNTPLGYRLLARYLLAVSYRPYRQQLKQLKPDLVVSLHPYLSMVLSAIHRREGGFRYAVVVTDLSSLLRGWADRQAELIVSPSDAATCALQRYGIPKARILSPFFPLSAALEGLPSPAAARRALGLLPARPTLLLTGGGSGSRKLLKPLALLADDPKWQLVVVCGKDEALYRQLAARYRHHPRVRVLSFARNMPQLMQACDIAIIKPGTATLLELLSLGKRIILTHDLGPQEKGNIRYALSYPNVRYLGGAWHKLPQLLDELLSQAAIKPAARPSAGAERIANALAALLSLPTSSPPHVTGAPCADS